LVEGGYTGTGNIDSDPLFVDAENGNYHLSDYSPAIGAGTTTGAPTTDIEANPRPNPAGTNPDMGAYENPYGVPQYQPQVLNVPADYSSIQAGLTAANATDTVLVQPGTYTENIFWPETNGIKLISAGDSSNTIIDGGGVSSVIYMNPQSATIDTTTLIQGFKITNGGNVSKGGGILLYNVSPKLIGLSIFNNNTTFDWPNRMGGGIYMTNSNPILTDVSIENNSSWQGGGLALYSSNPTLTNVKINNNYGNSGGSEGGGMYVNESSPILNNVLIKSNSASYGAGIHISYNSNPILTNISVEDNSASNEGGGITVLSSAINITNALIKGNSAHNAGGMYIASSSSIINNVVIQDNIAQQGGGIQLESNSSQSMTDVTIVGNTATGGYGGAGILFYGSSISPTFINVNIMYNNGAGISTYSGNPNNVITPTITNVNIIGNEIGIRAKSGTNPIIVDSRINI